ncbi:MAG: hypothetical protein HQ565_10105 [Bacteroidetes bacterium]|nr:hypothetical protein [Bacteroidota bacterium]
MPKTFTPKHHSDTTKFREALLAGPKEQTLRNIFAYARALDVVQTKIAGTVNVILN